MSLPVRAAGLTPDANGTLPSRPCTPDRTRRPLRCRCTEVFQPGETSNAHAAVHHTALPHRPTRSRFESLPLQSRRPEEQSLNSCKRQTVADHGNHQSGDRTRNWPVSYSETGLNKRRSNADPHAAMTLQTARSTTHVRRPTISHSGHKSGHRACRRAIPYSESRVTRCTREHALRQEWRNFLRLGDGDIDIFPSCDTLNKEVLPRERGGMSVYMLWALLSARPRTSGDNQKTAGAETPAVRFLAGRAFRAVPDLVPFHVENVDVKHVVPRKAFFPVLSRVNYICRFLLPH